MPGNDVEAYCLLCECKYEERSTTTIKVSVGQLPVALCHPRHSLTGWVPGAEPQKGKTKLAQLAHSGSTRALCWSLGHSWH